jgi:hypothetical protein
MRMPVDDLLSNWAYMVMSALAWNLKAWYGLLMPNRHRGLELLRNCAEQIVALANERCDQENVIEQLLEDMKYFFYITNHTDFGPHSFSEPMFCF